MAIYSEKTLAPKTIQYEIRPSGTLKPMRARTATQERQLEREIEVEIFLDPDIALALRNWLDEKLALLAAMQKRFESKSKPGGQ